MYVRPEFEIVTLSDEDVIVTSLIDKGDGTIDDIPVFEWPDPENP